MTKQQLATRYGYAGLIPFVASALLVWVAPERFALQAMQAFLVYSAIILSFLAGMIWILALVKEPENQHARGLLTWSILLSLLAWLAVLISGAFGVLFLLIAFVALRRVELKRLDTYYPQWFVELRNMLTRVVLASHLAVFVYLLQL